MSKIVVNEFRRSNTLISHGRILLARGEINDELAACLDSGDEEAYSDLATARDELSRALLRLSSHLAFLKKNYPITEDSDG